MEALRLQGNALVGSDPEKAVEFYMEALKMYDTKDSSTPTGACSLDEYTKCAGNAMTCLLKVGKRAECLALAKRALKTNPIFAKANGMWGRCLIEEAALRSPSMDFSHAMRLIFRAIYELPDLGESMHANIDAGLNCLLEEKEKTIPQTELEEALFIKKGTCGNSVYSRRSLPPYTEVSSTLHPFSVSPYEGAEERGCCVACSRTLSSFGEEEIRCSPAPCEKCKLMYYCSARCKDSYQIRHEKFECNAVCRLKAMNDTLNNTPQANVPEEFFEIALHCITTLSGFHSKIEGSDKLMELESHTQEVLQGLYPIGTLITQLLPDEPAELTTKIVGIICCNALELNDASGLGVGQALFVGQHNITSLFNHSCVPNCAIDPRKHSISTIRQIHPDEELTIAYIPHLYWPAKLRQDALAQRYYFTCRCERCLSSDDDPFEKAITYVLPNARANATKYYHDKVQWACTAVRCRHVDELSLKDVEDLLTLQKELMQHLFPFHYLCHELRNTLTFLYSVLDKPQECLDSCLDELLMWECIVSGALPVKQMKIQNAILCRGESECASKKALFTHLDKLATLYDVARGDGM